MLSEVAPDVRGTGNFNEGRGRSYTAKDIRFTMKGDVLYAIVMAWPDDGKVTIETLAQGKSEFPKQVGRVELLGASGPLPFERQAGGLMVTLPATRPNEYAYALKIRPA